MLIGLTRILDLFYTFSRIGLRPKPRKRFSKADNKNNFRKRVQYLFIGIGIKPNFVYHCNPDSRYSSYQNSLFCLLTYLFSVQCSSGYVTFPRFCWIYQIQDVQIWVFQIRLPLQRVQYDAGGLCHQHIFQVTVDDGGVRHNFHIQCCNGHNAEVEEKFGIICRKIHFMHKMCNFMKMYDVK